MYPMYCPQNYFSYLIFIRRSMKLILYERCFILAWPESTCCYTQGKDSFPCPDFKQWWLPQRGKWQLSSGTQVQLRQTHCCFIPYGVASTPTWDWIYSRWPVHTFQWLTSVTDTRSVYFPSDAKYLFQRVEILGLTSSGTSEAVKHLLPREHSIPSTEASRCFKVLSYLKPLS